MATDTLYETDFAIWAEEQGERLRRAAREGSNLPLDWDNLAEEIESLGRSQRGAVRSHVHNIIAHLIKLAHSPSARDWMGWDGEIGQFRRDLESEIEDSPSLRSMLKDAVERETPKAKKTAIRELRKHGELEAAAAVERTACSFTVEQVQDEEWYLPGTHERFLAQRDAGR